MAPVVANMNELRFDANDGVWRVAFVFDAKRQAMLLVAGDKSGGSEKRFYRQRIAKADEQFVAHQQLITVEEGYEEIAMKTLTQKIGDVGTARRKRVEARAAALIAEEMTLQELRQARKLTQVRLAKTLGISQDGVSRLEKRSDLLLSTLRKSVEAMGGNLSLVAEFPDREPVVLSGIAATELDPKPLRRKHARARH